MHKKNNAICKNENSFILDDDERQPCEIWTRVMGYHRPVTSFNTGKQGEFHERTYFNEPSVRHA
jgi:anaerobic ribonucleoside-triphosphate reductase